ncbi:MAG: GNAT family N-acetyltransferase [Caldilineaceae bacterium]
MPFSVRPARLPADYPAIAVVLHAEWSGADTAAELAYADAHREAQYHHAVFVAEEMSGTEPLLVGVAFVGHDTLAHREGKFAMNLRVHPDWQGQGVGKALYQAVLAHLPPMTPQELHAFFWYAHPRTLRFLTERGFQEAWRRLDLTLEVTSFDFTPYHGLEEKLRTQRITVKIYPELAADPERLHKLYELDWALWQDIPYGQAVTKRSFAQFVADEIDHPKFIADACFIAVQDGRFVGYLNLSEGDNDWNTEMTGVLPAYRGRDVATLLKLYSIRYAQTHGNLPLSTQNDAVNQADACPVGYLTPTGFHRASRFTPNTTRIPLGNFFLAYRLGLVAGNLLRF